jgi:hypothetical protein
MIILLVHRYGAVTGFFCKKNIVSDPKPDWIRIQSCQCIRIRIRIPDPDPGGQNDPQK